MWREADPTGHHPQTQTHTHHSTGQTIHLTEESDDEEGTRRPGYTPDGERPVAGQAPEAGGRAEAAWRVVHVEAQMESPQVGVLGEEEERD